MMARSLNALSTGRIQKRKTNLPQITIFGLQRAAGPYRWVIRDRVEPAAGLAMSALPRKRPTTTVLRRVAMGKP
jgi:hypothetical protein